MSLPSGSPPAHDPYAVLRIANFRRYLGGRFIASFGQQMLTVAVGWELYERTGSALHLGYVGLSQMLPMILCTLPAGHVADNFNRQRIVMLMTLVVALASVALTCLSALHAPLFWTYACLVVSGCARTFLWPASASLVPNLVPRAIFPKAVAWSTGSFHLSAVAGPAAAGGLLALTHHAAVIYALNVLAALTCFVMVSLIRYEPPPLTRQPLNLRSLFEGFNFVFHQRIILATITLDLFAVLLGGATALLPLFAKDILGVGPGGLGLLEAALPLGAILCSAVIAHRAPMERAGRALMWSVIAFGVATMVFGLSRSFGLSLAMLFACGVVDNVSVIIRHTLVQVLTPDEKRGRVSAVNSLFIGTSNEFGGFRAGFMANLLGPVIGNSVATGAMLAVTLGGAGTILAVLVVAWIWPELRRFKRLDGTG
ncbi:MAG: MFS transporter [Limisphaerales bacterium]